MKLQKSLYIPQIQTNEGMYKQKQRLKKKVSGKKKWDETAKFIQGASISRAIS